MNQGFFEEEESTIIRGDEVKNKKISSSREVNCKTCGLFKSCLSPRMKPTGEGELEILIVAEAPGKEDDKRGIQLVGKTGKLFRKIIEDLDYDLDIHFWKTNALNCRTKDNKEPDPSQIDACRKRLKKVIEERKPKAIIALGKYAVDGLVGDRVRGRLKKMTMSDWVGEVIPDQELKTWIIPTWSPSFVIKNKEDKVLIKQIQSHIKKAISYSNIKVPEYNDFEEHCVVITELTEAVPVLEKILEEKPAIAFDYETTGKKPYREGHKIVTASISTDETCWAFPFFEDPYFRLLFKKIMLDPKIKKYAQNAKFEALWSRHFLGVWPRGLIWDTMLSAHAEHNKKKTGLKYKIYTNFGVIGYDDVIGEYLKTNPREEKLYGANGFNSIESAPLDKLLLYNAVDSWFTYQLKVLKWESLSKERRKGILFFSEASMSLAKAEYNGVYFDEGKAEKVKKKMTRLMDDLETKVKASPELEKWNKPKAFAMSNTHHTAHLLFNLMGFEPTVFTATEKPSSTNEVLAAYNIPIINDVLEWRKWDKARGTYLKGFSRESIESIIHPIFNLHLVDTFRSSSDSPNFQNIPKRDALIKKLLRSLIKPAPGQKINEYDYKAIEVAIMTCYNLDPNLIKYVKDPTTDMHRDSAADLIIKDPAEIRKTERQIAKNSFVFPTFYGSWWKNTGENLWNDYDEETKAHLRSEGIKTLEDYQSHVQHIERVFWEDRFPVAYEWMQKTFKDYEKRGFIDLYTGFRCYGPMSRNQILNYRIQGSAFHCLLWTFMEVSKEIDKLKMVTNPFGQIHDAALYTLPEDEEKELDKIVWEIGTQKIREYWDWIIVPLELEKESSTVDGSWADMEDCGLLKF